MLIEAYFARSNSSTFPTYHISPHKRSLIHIVINICKFSTTSAFSKSLHLINTPKIFRCFLKLDSFDQFLVSGKVLKSYILLYITRKRACWRQYKKATFKCILQENFLTSNTKPKVFLAIYIIFSILPNIPTLVI